MQKELIDIAAYELRNPIQPILGLTEIVRKNENGSKQKELLDVVVRNARKLKQLTEDVLDVTRIESNTFQLHKEEINLNDLVLHTIQDYKDQIVTTAESKIILGYNNENMNGDSRANTSRVIVDKYRINQVIYNLLDNSIKFTKEKEGTIIINIKDDDNDNGVTGKGIDHEIAPDYSQGLPQNLKRVQDKDYSYQKALLKLIMAEYGPKTIRVVWELRSTLAAVK